MVAWSTVSVDAEGEDSNLGFLLRPANLQKYLGFSVHRCGGMAHIPDTLFPSKKKGKTEGTPRRTRSKGPSHAPVKEAEPSSSSEEGSVSPSLSNDEDSPRGDAPQVVEGPIVLDDSQDDDEDNVPLMARTRVLKRKAAEPSGEEEEAESSPFSNEGGAESPTYSEFIRMYPPSKRAQGVVVIFEGEGSVPSAEAIPSTEGGENEASSPSGLPSAVGAEPTLEVVEVGPMETSGGAEAEATTTELMFIPEVEGIIAPTDQEKAEPVITGSTSAMEAVLLEAQGSPEIPNEPEFPDSRVPLPEGAEPFSADTHLSAGIAVPEVRHNSEVCSEPEAPGPVVGEVTAGGSLAWWEVVGSQGDPILGLRHQLEVRCCFIAIRFGFSGIDFPLTLLAFFFFFFFFFAGFPDRRKFT
jgi:hypothetical protein